MTSNYLPFHYYYHLLLSTKQKAFLSCLYSTNKNLSSSSNFVIALPEKEEKKIQVLKITRDNRYVSSVKNVTDSGLYLFLVVHFVFTHKKLSNFKK